MGSKKGEKGLVVEEEMGSEMYLLTLANGKDLAENYWVNDEFKEVLEMFQHTLTREGFTFTHYPSERSMKVDNAYHVSYNLRQLTKHRLPIGKGIFEIKCTVVSLVVNQTFEYKKLDTFVKLLNEEHISPEEIPRFEKFLDDQKDQIVSNMLKEIVVIVNPLNDYLPEQHSVTITR